MRMGNKGKSSPVFWIAVVLVALYVTGNLRLPSLTQPSSIAGVQTQTGTGSCGFGTSTLRLTVDNAADGTVAYGNAYTYSADDTPVVGETLYDQRAEQLTAAGPVALNGYVMFGNDNFATGTTDRGAEVYYHKQPVSFGPCVGTFEIPKFFSYNESTPTWTGKDNGAIEATTNITVGANGLVDTTSLQIQTAAGGCLGNPDFDRPLAIVFNTSAAASSGVWDEVRPLNHEGTIATPAFLSGRGVVGQPYILPFGALCDLPSQPGKFETIKEFLIRMDAGASDVGSSSAATYSGNEDLYAMLLDKTWIPPVDGKPWTSGFAMDATSVADTDIGLASVTNAKLIAVG